MLFGFGASVSIILIYLLAYANRRTLSQWSKEWKARALERRSRPPKRKRKKRVKTGWSKDSLLYQYLRITQQLAD